MWTFLPFNPHLYDLSTMGRNEVRSYFSFYYTNIIVFGMVRVPRAPSINSYKKRNFEMKFHFIYYLAAVFMIIVMCKPLNVE